MTPRSDTEFLDTARRRYQFGLDVDALDREASEADNRFANATDEDKGQWDPIPLKMRANAERPIMQWNRIPVYVQQVVNDGRLNKPAIKVTASDGGDKNTAEFYQSRIRQIEYESNADIAYDTARDQQVTSGRGNIRVWCEFVPGTFRQRIRIDRIENQYSVVYDPAGVEYDRSDGDWCFVISQISKEEHERRYGKESIVSRLDFATMGRDNPAPGWIGVGDKAELIQIAEYWLKEYVKDELILLTDMHLPVWRSQLTDDQYKTFLRNSNIKRRRVDQRVQVRRYIINGAEILEEGDWIGTTIPIVPIWGREATVDGRRRTFSLIRMAKGPQKLVNLYVSNIAELIAMMPKVPYEAAVGSIPENLMQDWRDAGFDPKALLLYNQFNPDNPAQQFNQPKRVVNEPPIQALTIALQQAIDGIKAAMGIFDASLGARSNETSGKAIERRKQSAEIVNFHFSDNEARSRKRIGEILVEIIPMIDKAGSEVPIRFEDGKTQVVPIGKAYRHPKTGEEVIHNLTDGTYGVHVSTQASYDSQRQEINERDLALIQANPELMFIFGDQYFETDDAPGSEERARRMKRFIQMKTPGLIQEPGQQQDIPPEIAQKLQSLEQELQAAHGFAQEQLKKANDKSAELELKWRISVEQEKTKRAIGLTKVDADEAATQLEEELGVVHKKSDQDHEMRMELLKQRHAKDLQDMAQAGTLEQQEKAAELAPVETE